MINTQKFPTTEQLLVSGGDARIALDPVSGLNKYGCSPVPDPELLAFGSSTATTISQAGFAAADRLRELLQACTDTPDAVCAREMQRIRLELLDLAQVSDLDVRLVFATSGTHAHFIAARHTAAGQLLKVVMVEEDETGSGVAAALSAFDCAKVILRTADGEPRPIADIDADATNLVAKAVASGQRILLIMADQSKTGLIAPSPACVMQLHRRHPDQVLVLVDACQFRIAPSTLRAYLQQGFMVALTGSKFLAGPSFSAALLLPESQCMRDELVGFGLLLRWEAALVELRRFRALPQETIIDYLDTFARAIQYRLLNDSHFEPVAVPGLDRQPLQMQQSWDHIQTIFPFLLYHSTSLGRVPLSRSETLRVYRQLSQNVGSDSIRCQLGQPVACGTREGVAVSALRLCISARQISDAAAQDGISRVITDAMAALDKAARLI
ncbi:MAG: hypothetical protein NTY60_10680 [Proteobacteria bacterium]|nr:hypothetical protein [Pseudomonadota bacterium]